MKLSWVFLAVPILVVVLSTVTSGWSGSRILQPALT